MFQGFAIACVLAAAVFCGSHRAAAQAGAGRMGLPQDWSHHHVIFSNTRDMPTLLKIRQDPRLLHQWLRHNASAFYPANRITPQEVPDQFQMQGPESEENGVDALEKRVDWSVSLGGTNSHLTRSKYPAKYSFDISAPPTCANDFVVFSTVKPGSATQATIVGFNNLYSGQGGPMPGICGNSGPTVKWAYNTGSVIMTSPVISLDGTKVAFVSRIPGTVHVLTIGTTGSNGTSPIAPVVPGPLLNDAKDTRVALNGGRSVSSSSLFVDYGNDVGYVGDDGGVLHKITGVFNGVPAEVTTGRWPVLASAAGAMLNDPVFDFVSGNIFVTDSAGNLSYVRDVNSITGTCVISGLPPCLGFPVIAVSQGSAIIDSPVIDYVTGRVFSETADGASNSEIIQTDTALGNVVRVNVGQRDVTRPLHNGAFDANYLNSVSTGFYYVCGKSNNAPLVSTLYRIGFNATGVMNSVPGAATLNLSRLFPAQCSPVTQFFNPHPSPGRQWLFVSVSTRCGATVPSVIGGGCIMVFDTTNGMPAAATARVAELNGTSGIIIDNVSTVAQASSIYFTDQGTGACGDGIATGGCAVKLTQSGLK